MKRLYTAEATAYEARLGSVVSSDKRLDLQLSRPREMGGDGGPGTNPEQLFAAGYAACFHSATRFAVKKLGLPADGMQGSHVTARVSFLKGGVRRLRARRRAEPPRPEPGGGPGQAGDGADPHDLPVLQGHRGEHRRGAPRRVAARRAGGPSPADPPRPSSRGPSTRSPPRNPELRTPPPRPAAEPGRDRGGGPEVPYTSSKIRPMSCHTGRRYRWVQAATSSPTAATTRHTHGTMATTSGISAPGALATNE